MDPDRTLLKEGFELETFAKEKQKDFFSHVGAREQGRGKESEEEEENEKEEIEYDHDITLQQDMQIMKDSQRNWDEDKYLSGGNVTALIELDEYEREDEALVITMKNIHKTYLLGLEGVPALRGVSMSVRRGEFLTIFGTSGGGKTSLLNIMGTIDKPTKGNMKICGTRISRSTTDTELSEIRRCKLGFVFQTFNLLSSLTALENVMLPMILAGKYSRAERQARAIKLLTRVGMGERLHHLPSQLSGGEQQRVTIARSIANEPDILLLDEPTGDLDTVNTLIVMKLLAELHTKDKMTLVMVTHDMGLKPFADRVVWMRDGRIQTVENIPERKRQEAYAKLDEECAKYNVDINAFESEDVPADEEMGISSSGNNELSEENETKSVTFTHTEVRQPHSYTTHRSVVHADDSYDQLKALRVKKAQQAAARRPIPASRGSTSKDRGAGVYPDSHGRQRSSSKPINEVNGFEINPPSASLLGDLSDDSSGSSPQITHADSPLIVLS